MGIKFDGSEFDVDVFLSQLQEDADDEWSPRVLRIAHKRGLLAPWADAGWDYQAHGPYVDGSPLKELAAHLDEIREGIAGEAGLGKGEWRRQFSAAQGERESAVAMLTAEYARDNPMVRWFRETYLGGPDTTLHRDEVTAWITRLLDERPPWPDGATALLELQARGDEPSQTYEVQPGTTLDMLRSCAVTMAPWWYWTEGQAVHFILTGVPPDRPQATFQVVGMPGTPPGTWRIQVNVDPLIAPNELAAQFIEFRRSISGPGRQRFKPPESAATTLSGHVSRMSWLLPDFSWRNRLQLWNRLVNEVFEPHEGKAFSTVTEFKKAVRRARLNLLYPTAFGIEPPSSDELMRRVEPQQRGGVGHDKAAG